jgi:uncharacterized protein YegP (UPF0339 family)
MVKWWPREVVRDDNMATESTTDGALNRWYRSRIGTATTDDEVRGYWLFALGVVLGVAGILLFVPSESAGALRQWAVVAAATGLVCVFAGPIIRLPLKRGATLFVYAGAAICLVAVAWFVLAYPYDWSPQTGQPTIVVLYSLGLLAMGLGGVFVPLLTTGVVGEDEHEALQSEAEDLRHSVSDTEADESDLAAQLRALRQSQARFELYEDKGGQYRWRLRHRNGNVIADGGEGYTQKHNAQKGMQSVQRNALGATVLHVESETDLPEAEESFEPVEETPSQASFELYEDNAGEFRFRLRHDNGNVIADGGEGYTSRSGARTAIERIQEYVGPADYLQFDPTGFEIYRDSASEWRWRLVHRNGNVLADSGEGYSRRRDARRAVNRIRSNLDDMTVEVYEDAGDEYRWHLESANGRLMADSGEGYADRGGAEDAVERFETYASEASVLDVGRAAFELFEDSAGDARWRLRHRNGNILADAGQGYADRTRAREGIESVKRHAPNADTEE